MSQEGAAKLRLKPRKAPPPPRSREPSPGRESPRRRQTLADGCAWFEKDNLNECEKTWILLLKDMGQDLRCANWQTVPSFPEFLGKGSEEESLQKQEVFTVGTKDFQWVSFPSFCKEKCGKPEDHSSHLVAQSQVDHLHNRQGQADELPSLTVTDQAKNMSGEDTKGISKLDASPKSYKFTQHSSTHHLVVSQSSAKAFSFPEDCRGTVQNSRENRKGNDRKELQNQTHQGSISFGEAQYEPTEKQQLPLVSVPGTESCKTTENQSGASATLDSCPMCLVDFSGTLSQMDIDGHLARCLSESADDVMW